MEVSLNEAAVLMGKTPRQVRYLLQQAKITARKVDNVWVIDAESLPLNDAQKAAINARAEVVRESMSKAFEPLLQIVKKGVSQQEYTVRSLNAFKIGEVIYRVMVKELGPADEATRFLRRSLELMGQGYHSFYPDDKLEYYKAARESGASALMSMLLDGAPDDERRQEIAHHLEGDYLPSVSGLVRYSERNSRSRKFQNFGSKRNPLDEK